MSGRNQREQQFAETLMREKKKIADRLCEQIREEEEDQQLDQELVGLLQSCHPKTREHLKRFTEELTSKTRETVRQAKKDAIREIRRIADEPL